MPELTVDQVKTVMHDVDNAGINYSHLGTDLIDHICCDIEVHMDRGCSFHQAYGRVKDEFGIKGLRQIQQDTLMLIDKNYRIMKKSMKAIGLLAMVLMAFGALFKIHHWPGAAVMLVLSYVFTLLVFFPALLFVVYKELNNKKLLGKFIVSFLGGTLFMAGVCLKIMHWPGASVSLSLGIIMVNFILIPLVIFSKKSLPDINQGVLNVGLLALFVSLFGLLFKINFWPGATILLGLGGILLVLIFVPLYYYYEVKNVPEKQVGFLFLLVALTYFIVFSFLLNLNLNRKSNTHEDPAESLIQDIKPNPANYYTLTNYLFTQKTQQS